MRESKMVMACAAGLLIGGLFLSLVSCADEGESFTVTPGSYHRVQVTGSGSVSFTVIGIDMDLDRVSRPIVYYYDAYGYGGGGRTGGVDGELCNYTMRHINSKFNYQQGSVPHWKNNVARNVTLEWGSDYFQFTIDGVATRMPGPVPKSFTLGIGYPPPVRSGWDGAVYTDIVWPKGATQIK